MRVEAAEEDVTDGVDMAVDDADGADGSDEPDEPAGDAGFDRFGLLVREVDTESKTITAMRMTPCAMAYS